MFTKKSSALKLKRGPISQAQSRKCLLNLQRVAQELEKQRKGLKQNKVTDSLKVRDKNDMQPLNLLLQRYSITML